MGHFIEAGGKSHPLDAGKRVLGQGADADLVLPACVGLASQHAEVRPLLGGFVIKHLAGSEFKTLVNGDLLETCKTLSDRDVVHLGELELTFALELSEDEPQQAMPAGDVPPMPTTVDDARAVVGEPVSDESPLPTNLSPEAPPELPPLPANLVKPSAEAVASELPPLPANLSSVSSFEESPTAQSIDATPSELPPLPAHLLDSASPTEETRPAQSIEATPSELPPLPGNLGSASSFDETPVDPLSPPAGLDDAAAPPRIAASDAGGIPPLSELVVSEPPPSSTPSPSPGSGKVSARIQLAPSDRKKASPIRENLIAIAATLVVLGSGVTLLMKRANKLSDAGGASVPNSTLPANPDPSVPPETITTPGEEAVPWAVAHEDLKLNYRFYPPAKDWTRQNDGVFDSGHEVQLVSDSGRCRFLLFAEAVGDGVSENDLIAQAKHRTVVTAQTMNFKPPVAETIAGLPFQRFDATGMMGTSHYFVNLTLNHKGFFYHLVTLGEIPEEGFIKTSARAMAERFELIDPERQLTLRPQHDVRGFRDPYHGYAMNLDRLAWAVWKRHELEFPAAQFAALSHNGLPFGVVPVRFNGAMPDIDDFASAALAGFDLVYPSRGLKVKGLEYAGMKGRSIVAKQILDGKVRNYYLRVLLGTQVGYLLGGWGEGRADYHTRSIVEAMESVEFFEPETRQLASALNYGQRKGQSRIRYQLGIQSLCSGNVEQALEMFEQVVREDGEFVEIAIPLVEAFAANGRINDGLAFMQQWLSSNDDPELRVAQALLQCSAGDWDAGREQLSSLFAMGVGNDLALRRYLARLQDQPESSNGAVISMDPVKLAGRERLFQAAQDNLAGRHNDALAILNPLRNVHPQEPLLLMETITARVGLSRPDSASALARSVSAPSLAASLQAHRYLCMEKFEKANESLTTAVRLAPNEPAYVAELLAWHATKAEPSETVLGASPTEIAQQPLESPQGTAIERRLKVGLDGDLEVEDVARFAGVSAGRYWQLFESLHEGERLERLSRMLPLARNVELSEARFEHLATDDSAPAALLLRYTVRGAFHADGDSVRGALVWPLETMVLDDPSILAGPKLVGRVSIDLPKGWRFTEAWPTAKDPALSWHTTADQSRISLEYQVAFPGDAETHKSLLMELGSDVAFARMAVAMAVDDEQQ